MAPFLSDGFKRVLFSFFVIAALLTPLFLPEILGLRPNREGGSILHFSKEDLLPPKIASKGGVRDEGRRDAVEPKKGTESAPAEDAVSVVIEQPAAPAQPVQPRPVPQVQQVSRVPSHGVLDLDFILGESGRGLSGGLAEIQYLLNDGRYYEFLRVRQLKAARAPARATDERGWGQVRQGSFFQELRRSEAVALGLMSEVPPNFTAASFSLARYVSGIRFVLEDGERYFASPQAVQYLRELHQDVTKALSDPNLNASYREQWLTVPVLDLLNGLNQQQPGQQQHTAEPFLPGLSLFSVNVRQAPDSGGRFNPIIIPNLGVQGFVRDSRATKVQLLQEGVMVAEQGFPPQLDGQGLKRFGFNVLDARGTFEIRVLGGEGQQYSRLYQFYPRIRSFQWAGGNYFVPFQTGDIDPRLDRYFSVGLNQGRAFFDTQGIAIF